jgi:hypothetical protein
MNEKIKELALQAGGSHYPDVGGKTLEKFAELLIQECISVVTFKCASPTAREALIEHFEVEL